MEKNNENKYMRKIFYDLETVRPVSLNGTMLLEADRCEQILVNDNVLGEARAKKLIYDKNDLYSEDIIEEISSYEAERYLKGRIKSWYDVKNAKPRGFFKSNSIYDVPRHTEFSVGEIVISECTDNECWSKKEVATLPVDEESIYVSIDVLAKSMEVSKDAIHQLVLNSNKEEVKKLQK